MLKNLVTLVTGGASGLGRATVNRFVQKGSRVVFCDLPTSPGEEVAKEIGENVNYIPADVTSENDIKILLDEITKKYGKLDVVVNCAGITNSFLIYKTSDSQTNKFSDFQKLLLTNVAGTLNVIQLAAELMSKNKENEDNCRGVIVNTSGIEAFKGAMGQSLTAAAAGAIHSMTTPLAADLSIHGIRVVTIAPGYIKTPIYDKISDVMQESISQDFIIAPKRFGDPDEFAHLVQAIVANPYINATTIQLDGGIQMTI